jgi:hypothetical protein
LRDFAQWRPVTETSLKHPMTSNKLNRREVLEGAAAVAASAALPLPLTTAASPAKDLTAMTPTEVEALKTRLFARLMNTQWPIAPDPIEPDPLCECDLCVGQRCLDLLNDAS